MSCSEVITIMVVFHGGFRNMKHFYIYYVQKHLGHLFPDTVSYNRFVELMQAVALPMDLFMKTCCMGEATGTINNIMCKMVQLNQDQAYTFDRETLIEMLDELLAEAEK